MTHLDLFSGIGGFALAARWAGIETVQFVEYEPYAQKVLAKNFPGVPIAGDIYEFDATKFLGVGLVTGGFPCQPFSVAGKQLGAEDDRAIWPQMLRVIQEARPTWVIGENVTGIITMELDNVLSDLEREGYTTQTLVIPAASVDAKHRRDRCWIIAHTTCTRRTGGERCMETDGCDLREEVQTRFGTSEDVSNSSGNRREQMPDRIISKRVGIGEQIHEQKRDPNCPQETYVPNSNSIRLNNSLERQEEIRFSKCGNQQTEGQWNVANSNSNEYIVKGKSRQRAISQQSSGSSLRARQEEPCRWPTEPGVGRVANGVPSRVDRLKGLGNAIVPAVAYEIMRHMKEVT